MNPTTLGIIGPGFLNRVPTLPLDLRPGKSIRTLGLGIRLHRPGEV